MNNYLIYADKPESYDRCGDSFWGDTIFAFELSRDEVLNLLVNCLSVNLSTHENEKGYDIVLLFDCHPLDSVEKYNLYLEATPLAQKRIDDSRAEEKRLVEEKERKRKEDMEKRERTMFESLKKKFEPSGL